MLGRHFHRVIACFLCPLTALVPVLFSNCLLSRAFLATPLAETKITLHEKPSSPLDLEVGGDLAGTAPNSLRYVTRQDLLSLPQVTYTVTQDPNFQEPTAISGIPLDELSRLLSANPPSDLVIAICNDLYRATYPRSYINVHRPVLVLLIDGKPPDAWPKDPESQTFSMGPYLISHPHFTPAFKVLSHSDEPQIPWGVVRLEFRDEQRVFDAIAPKGPHAADAEVQNGYRIAQQNCFRCHDNGGEGGQKTRRPWVTLAAFAALSPDYFAEYVTDPKSKNPRSQMKGFPNYDAATIRALVAYFRTFAPASPGKS